MFKKLTNLFEEKIFFDLHERNDFPALFPLHIIMIIYGIGSKINISERIMSTHRSKIWKTSCVNFIAIKSTKGSNATILLMDVPLDFQTVDLNLILNSFSLTLKNR